jgi:thiamine-monophosphate kinase
MAIRKLASAAMDVSDGLLTDLRKLCVASHCGARLQLESLPQSVALTTTFGALLAEHHALQGGDDYELLFTASHENLLPLQAALAAANVICTPIGCITDDAAVQCYRKGELVLIKAAGFEHFAGV